jgi:hypothetical protein
MFHLPKPRFVTGTPARCQHQRKVSDYAAHSPHSRNRDAPAGARRLVQLWDRLTRGRPRRVAVDRTNAVIQNRV